MSDATSLSSTLRRVTFAVHKSPFSEETTSLKATVVPTRPPAWALSFGRIFTSSGPKHQRLDSSSRMGAAA